MKIHYMKQGSTEWFAIRAGMPTASEFGSLVTPLWKPREGAGVETYLMEKLAERWLSQAIVSFSGGAMEQGKILEEEAVPYYELTASETIQRVGFVTSDDPRCGCSPDGLLADGGIEIKCPQPHTHVGYLLANTLPKDYAAQVHGGMLVTGAASWKFMSYCRGFPPLLLTIKRDNSIIDRLRASLNDFNKRLDTTYEQLLQLNGGPPPPPQEVEVHTMEGVDENVLDDFFNGG